MTRALGAGLQQQHAVGAALAQPAGDDRARRARTDDDVVIGGGLAWHGVSSFEMGCLFGGGSNKQRLGVVARSSCGGFRPVSQVLRDGAITLSILPLAEP